MNPLEGKTEVPNTDFGHIDMDMEDTGRETLNHDSMPHMPQPEIPIPPTRLQALNLQSRLLGELDHYRRNRIRYDDHNKHIADLARKVAEAESSRDKLSNDVEETRKRNRNLESQLLEQQNKKAMLDTISKNAKSIGSLKDIAYNQMNQITSLRNMLAREIAGRNNKIYSKTLYEFDKIPAAWEDCSAFEEAQRSLLKMNDELTKEYSLCVNDLPRHRQKIEELEKLVALRAIEARIHHINKQEALKELDDKWCEGEIHFATEINEPMMTMIEYRTSWETEKRMALESYENVKKLLQERYDLKDWS